MSTQPTHPNQPVSEEEAVAASFRESLSDMIVILERIGPLCNDIDGLISMLQLAIRNDSQLNLIIHQVKPRQLRG